MADYTVVDKWGNVWDVPSSKAAAEAARVALTKRHPEFKPFAVKND
jgi:hypothetical protein